MWENRNLIVFTVVLFAAILLFGCSDSAQDTQTIQPRIRASLKSTGSGTVRATVFVEGPDGNALSGAVVTVKDTRNTLTQLMYDSVACSYNGVLEEPGGETNYTVEVSSILLSSIFGMEIPYSVLGSIPNVTVFQDSGGNSVLHGQNLLSNLPIQIGWSDCGENAVYQITIKTALKSVYAVSSNACTVTIPASAIPAGSYLLEITAQKIRGDIYYRTAPYYSASFATAPMVSCYVN